MNSKFKSYCFVFKDILVTHLFWNWNIFEAKRHKICRWMRCSPFSWQPKTAMLCFWETEALTSHWHQDSCVTQSPGNELLLFLLPLHCPEQTASSCFLLIYCASAANGTVVFYVRSTQPIKYWFQLSTARYFQCLLYR